MSRRPAVALLISALIAAATVAAAPAAVAADRDCGDFASQRAAQLFFLSQGGPQYDPHRLDSDGDGIACETNPPPYYYGTSLPSGGGGSAPQPEVVTVRSIVQLALVPNKRITGETFRMKVSVRPAISREIVVQRKTNGQWKHFASGVTGRNGKTSGEFKAPKAGVTYRAIVASVTKAGKKYSAATSRVRTMVIQRQRIVLDFNDRRVAEGEAVRALIRAIPVRAGRPVILQVKSASVWQTVRRGNFDRRGRATFTIVSSPEHDLYRAVALGHRGAATEQSDVERLTATDATAPPTPYDLMTISGDGTVELSWTRNLPADFAHHEVWMRTAETPWTIVGTTPTDRFRIFGLENDVTHWFTVTSVDTNGNSSPMADEIAATPTASTRVSKVRY